MVPLHSKQCRVWYSKKLRSCSTRNDALTLGPLLLKRRVGSGLQDILVSNFDPEIRTWRTMQSPFRYFALFPLPNLDGPGHSRAEPFFFSPAIPTSLLNRMQTILISLPLQGLAYNIPYQDKHEQTCEEGTCKIPRLVGYIGSDRRTTDLITQRCTRRWCPCPY